MYKKVLIANRGEVAIRVIRACREMGIKTVAVYSKADKDSLHVALADEAYCIGNSALKDSYLNEDAIITIAQGTKTDAIHPGYGLLSENASFAKKCQENHLAWIGPSYEVMDLLSRKDDARAIAKKARVPMTEGSQILKSSEEAIKWAEKIGYPVLLKARSGGGGKGIRIVESASEMQHAYVAAKTEAKTAFGDGALFLEKYLTGIKHIEVQIIADKSGNIAVLGERDCSVQRSNQKLIEESPAHLLSDKTRKKLYSAARKLVKESKYVTVGTIEFLMDSEENIYFCEMNTRLQVEHSVTEMVTGIDLVKWQIRTAAGYEIPFGDFNNESGVCAIECRINAENAETGMASCGTVELFHAPGGPGVRFDTFLYQGMQVSPFYDSLLGKLIVRGCDREEAIRKMRSALSELVVTGIDINADLHLKILREKDFIVATYGTDFFKKFKEKSQK